MTNLRGIAGVDEAGRGPMIGPMVICGILVDLDRLHELVEIGAKDSKTLTHKRRLLLKEKIEKVTSKIEIRAVSAADIDRLVGEIEAALQAIGRAEVSSRVVGDMVIAGIKELDQIAYIRYAIVYLGLDDLHAIRKEIDHLLEG